MTYKCAGSIFEVRKRRLVPGLLYTRFTVLAAEIGILSAFPGRLLSSRSSLGSKIFLYNGRMLLGFSAFD